MSDTREKLIRERVDLIDAIDYAMRDFDDYLDECNETCTPPIDKLEDFIADGVFSAGYRKKQEWIPVSERLPEQTSRCLVARYDYVTKTPFIDILWFEKGKWWNRLHGGDYAVTHWMPLPEPPKGE